jgi:hypothetical protein
MLAGIEKAHQDQFEKQKTPLTPAELKQLNLTPPAGAVGFKDAFGNISFVQGEKPPDEVLTPAQVKASPLAAASGPGRVFVRGSDGKITTIDAPATETSFTKPTEQQKADFPGVIYMGSTGKPYFTPTPAAIIDQRGQSDAEKLIVKDLDLGYTGARQGAIPALIAANRMQQQLDKGIISGYGAAQPAVMGMAEIFAKMGLGDPTKVADTQKYMASALQEFLPLAKAMFPQRVTNTDLRLTELMSGTNPANTKAALQLAVDVAKQRANLMIQQHNENVDKYVTAFPNQANIGNYFRIDPSKLPVDVPPAARAPAAPAAPVLKPGGSYTWTPNGGFQEKAAP